MKINISKFSPYAPAVLRVGIAFVFLWFGWTTVADPAGWTGLVPAWTSFLGDPVTLVRLHGIFEFVFGLLLLLGIKTRIVAALLLLNLLHTLTLLSWGPILVRDIGISMALLSLALQEKKPAPSL